METVDVAAKEEWLRAEARCQQEWEEADVRRQQLLWEVVKGERAAAKYRAWEGWCVHSAPTGVSVHTRVQTPVRSSSCVVANSKALWRWRQAGWCKSDSKVDMNTTESIFDSLPRAFLTRFCSKAFTLFRSPAVNAPASIKFSTFLMFPMFELFKT